MVISEGVWIISTQLTVGLPPLDKHPACPYNTIGVRRDKEDRPSQPARAREKKDMRQATRVLNIKPSINLALSRVALVSYPACH